VDNKLLTEPMQEILQLLVDCEAVENYFCSGCGLADAIDNYHEPYQSAALAGWLKIAKRAGLQPMLQLRSNA
jgi:hypothetical protein